MAHWLAPTVHLTTVSDDLVFLDTRTDAYFCLPGAGGAVAVGPDGLTVACCDTSLLDEFVEAGLVLQGERSAAETRAPAPVLGTRDLRTLVSPPLQAADIGRMTRAALRLYRYGHQGTLTRLLRAARDLKASVADLEEDRVIDLVLRCEQMIPWVPFHGECLFRSFLTLSVLRGAGASVSWIFGVQTWPFRAHCWLQRGDLVLNDTAEHVSGYSAILTT